MCRWRALLAMILLLLAVVIAYPNLEAFACGGAPPEPSLNQLIEDADYIVKARIIEKDARDKNVILEVDKFLTGGQGPRYMLWYRVYPRLTAAFIKHGYDTACSFDGDPGFNLDEYPYNAGYFALKRLDTGIYITANSDHEIHRRAIATLPFDKTYIPVRKDPNLTDEKGQNVKNQSISNQEELETLIATLSGDEPIEPDAITTQDLHQQSVLIPFTSPLRLITNKGTHYVMPVDGQKPVTVKPQPIELWSPYAYPGLLEKPGYCATTGCQLTIPDASSYAVQKNAHEISLDHGWYPPSPYRDEIIVNGQAFTYSPDSNYMAVWNNKNLQIYLIASSYFPSPSLVVDIPLRYSASEKSAELYGNIRWSHNDSTFAYHDASGIWIMDVTQDSEPELTIPAGTTQPQALALSSTGRYLAYRTDTKATSWILLDRSSGNKHENSIVSRDEQFIATLTHEDAPEKDRVCQAPIAQTCSIILSDVTQFEWLNNNFLVAIKQQQDRYNLLVAQASYWLNGYFDNVSSISGDYELPIHYAYDEQSRMLAIVTSASQHPTSSIVKVFSERQLIRERAYSFKPVSIDFKLDGPVVDVEWMPSYFHYD